MSQRLIDITGQKFGRLTAIECVASGTNQHAQWRCMCDCGTETIVAAQHLKQGTTKSCGCLRLEITRQRSTIHGKCYEKLYCIWKTMRQRCSNSKARQYPQYGGRGICVCDEWQNNFMAFYHWAMTNDYSHGLSIDRIDNDGNYEPTNCRWATKHQQGANKRNNTDFVGVVFNKRCNSFTAHLQVGGKYVYRKTFKTKLEAITARLQAEKDCGIILNRQKGEQPK